MPGFAWLLHIFLFWGAKILDCIVLEHVLIVYLIFSMRVRVKILYKVILMWREKQLYIGDQNRYLKQKPFSKKKLHESPICNTVL